MRLHLVRHGRTSSNVARLLDTAPPGAPLDPIGLVQAAALVERLTRVELDGLYTSDIVRAVQTGTPLAVARGLSLTPLTGLREIRAGDLEMSPVWDGYLAMLRSWATGQPEHRRPGGEDGAAFLERFDAAVAAVAEAGHGSALLVSHGAAIRMWAGARARGLSAAEVTHRPLGNTAVITLDGEPGAWTYLDWDEGVPGPLQVDAPAPPGIAVPRS